MFSLKSLCRYTLLFLSVAVLTQCVVDQENPSANCDIVGTWMTSEISIDSCARLDQGFVLRTIDQFCVPLAQGDICRESRWTFTEEGTFSIDVLLVFTFDDNREEVSNQIDGTYTAADGVLDICVGSRCTMLSCDSDDESNLELTFSRSSCAGTIVLSPI